MLEAARGPAVRAAATCCVRMGKELNEHMQDSINLTRTGMAMMNSNLGVHSKAADLTMSAMAAKEWHIRTQDDLDSIRAQLTEAKKVIREHYLRFNAFMQIWLNTNEEIIDTLDNLDAEYDAHLKK